MKLQGIPIRVIINELYIRNDSQVETRMRWYRNGELHRLEQPVGKQYTYGKGFEFTSEVKKLQAEIRFLGVWQCKWIKSFKSGNLNLL